MAETLEELGYRPMIYGGQILHWWGSQQHTDLAQALGRWPFWQADYRERERIPVDREGRPFPWPGSLIWQYTSKGQVAGISGDVDLNRFKGSLEDLRAVADGRLTTTDIAAELYAISERTTGVVRTMIRDCARLVGEQGRC